MSEKEMIRRGLKNMARKAIHKTLDGIVVVIGISAIVLPLIAGAFMCI